MAGGMVHQSFRGTIIGGWTLENGFPIIGRLAIPGRVVFRRTPDVPVTFWIANAAGGDATHDFSLNGKCQL